jgi:hypothetical protein
MPKKYDSPPVVVENVSKHPILSPCAKYKRVHFYGKDYVYDSKHDLLIQKGQEALVASCLLKNEDLSTLNKKPFI